MVRNAQPGDRHWGGTFGTLYAGIDMWLNYLGIGLPWTLKHHADQHHASAQGQLPADRISQARRRSDVRPPVLGVPVEHQP